jgi:hypothetical protein
MKRKMVKTFAAACSALGIVGFAPVANAAVAPDSAPTWHTVYTRVANGEFDAVVATGKTSGFAFFEVAATVAVPVAYERTGATTFKQVPFPTVVNEWVAGASASSPSNVYVFADILTANSYKPESEVLKWTGSRFAVVATFPGELSGGTALSPDDVYAYGSSSYGGGSLRSAGDYHYNGHAWTKISSTISGNGDALSGSSAYVVSGKDVYHYNGTKWTATSLAGLLPAGSASTLSGVLALSADNVYATGEGRPGGGPAVILHYNGRTWSKVASYPVGAPGPLASDGKGGLWVTAWNAGAGSPSYLLHYSGGKLTAVAAPKFDGGQVFADSLSQVPGTTEELAGGVVPSPVGKSYHPPVILQYS